MGAALRRRLGRKPPLALWASPTGRALQTLAVIAEHLELDWHDARTDIRLREIDIGAWGELYYADVMAEAGPIIDRTTGLFVRRPPGGEWYDEIAVRLSGWLDDTKDGTCDRLIVMHGMSSRVLRGLLTGAADRPGYGTAVADGVRQGAMAEIVDGVERILEQGDAFDPY